MNIESKALIWLSNYGFEDKRQAILNKIWESLDEIFNQKLFIHNIANNNIGDIFDIVLPYAVEIITPAAIAEDEEVDFDKEDLYMYNAITSDNRDLKTIVSEYVKTRFDKVNAKDEDLQYIEYKINN